MGWAAFVDKMFVNICALLLSVLMLKQIIMNLYDLFNPKCKKPKMFRDHKMTMLNHYEKYAEDYGKHSEADSIHDKQEHYEAEKQTLMADMPPHLVP